MLKVVIFVSWQANREYIAQNYCENRDNPDSDCAGSCQLAKQIENADENHDPFVPHKSIEKVELAVYDVVKGGTTQQNTFYTLAGYCHGDVDLVPCNFTFSVFHPPEMKV